MSQVCHALHAPVLLSCLAGLGMAACTGQRWVSQGCDADWCSGRALRYDFQACCWASEALLWDQGKLIAAISYLINHCINDSSLVMTTTMGAVTSTTTITIVTDVVNAFGANLVCQDSSCCRVGTTARYPPPPLLTALPALPCLEPFGPPCSGAPGPNSPLTCPAARTAPVERHFWRGVCCLEQGGDACCLLAWWWGRGWGVGRGRRGAGNLTGTARCLGLCKPAMQQPSQVLLNVFAFGDAARGAARDAARNKRLKRNFKGIQEWLNNTEFRAIQKT